MTCRLCRETKPATDFYVNVGRVCKPCFRARQAAYSKTPQRRTSRQQRLLVYRKRDRPREAALMRQTYARYPEKFSARLRLREALRRGEVLRPDACPSCGSTRRRVDGRSLIQGHHSDYDRPLDVVWLCSVCHGKEHWSPAPRRRSQP